MTYADLPTEVQKKVTVFLTMNNFPAAKELFEHWKQSQVAA